MKSSSGSSNRPGPHHSAGGPAIGGNNTRCKTTGSENGVARSHFKPKVLRRF